MLGGLATDDGWLERRPQLRRALSTCFGGEGGWRLMTGDGWLMAGGAVTAGQGPQGAWGPGV